MGGTDKGGAEEGGVVELWERRTDGGLGCGEKIDSEDWKEAEYQVCERGASLGLR